MAGQYPKGLRVPMIVKAKASAKEEDNWNGPNSITPLNKPWDPNLDQIMTLTDWYESSSTHYN